MDFFSKKNKDEVNFLFQCNDCKMILSVNFDEEEDLERVRDNLLELECQCGSTCRVLRN